MIKDIAVLIHGISPQKKAGDPTTHLREFFNELRQHSQHIQSRFKDEQLIFIQWGHPSDEDPSAASSDQRIYFAQQQILVRLNSIPLPANPNDRGPLSRAVLARTLHNEILISGFGDVVYFVGSQGYGKIVGIVLDQVRKRIDALVASGYLDMNDQIRLHLIGHSLGVTIGFEFLLSIFSDAQYVSSYFAQKDDETSVSEGSLNRALSFQMTSVTAQENVEFYSRWRQRFIFGSFIATASQLPLLLQRRQVVIDSLANEQQLDPRIIGITGDPRYRWLLFHDPRDLLSFNTKILFSDEDSIVETEVQNKVDATLLDVGKKFSQTHENYRFNEIVKKMALEQLLLATDHIISD